MTAVKVNPQKSQKFLANVSFHTKGKWGVYQRTFRDLRLRTFVWFGTYSSCSLKPLRLSASSYCGTAALKTSSLEDISDNLLPTPLGICSKIVGGWLDFALTYNGSLPGFL